MPTVSLDDLLEKIPNKFTLVMVAAKRARQIKDGAPRLVATHSVNPVTVAMEEISAGKIVLDNGVVRILDDFGRPMGEIPAEGAGERAALGEEAGHGSAMDLLGGYFDEIGDDETAGGLPEEGASEGARAELDPEADRSTE